MCYFGSPRIFRLKAQISEISAGNVDKQALLRGYEEPKAASFKSSVSSAVFFFVHPNPSGLGGRLRAPHAPNSSYIKPQVSTRTVSGLTWALQGTKENTGGILPCWQPSKIPQLGPRASRDKAGVCRSSAALPTFPTLGIYSALCHENLNFKRGILQLERARAGNKREEGERAGNFCAVQGCWDGFLLQIPRAGALRGACLQISCE